MVLTGNNKIIVVGVLEYENPNIYPNTMQKTLVWKNEFSLELNLRNSALNTHSGLIQSESPCFFTFGCLHSQTFTSLQYNTDILKYYFKVLFILLFKTTSSESTNMQHITLQSVLSLLLYPAPPTSRHTHICYTGMPSTDHLPGILDNKSSEQQGHFM